MSGALLLGSTVEGNEGVPDRGGQAGENTDHAARAPDREGSRSKYELDGHHGAVRASLSELGLASDVERLLNCLNTLVPRHGVGSGAAGKPPR